MVSQLCGSDPGDYAPLINDDRGSSPLFSFFFTTFHPNLDIRPIEIPWTKEYFFLAAVWTRGGAISTVGY